MPGQSRRALEEWKGAEAAAREAERQLAAAWDRYERAHGPLPPEDLMHEVKRLRAVAMQRLDEAIGRLGGREP